MGALIVLLFLFWLILQTCWAQNKLLPGALNAIGDAIGTQVEAEDLDIDFFEEITLNNILIRDSKSDTLLSANSLHLDFSFFAYFSKEVKVDQISIDGATMNLLTREGISNYQHIIDHLNENIKPSSESKPSPWNLDLESVSLTNSKIKIEDEYTRMILDAKSLTIDLDDFQSSMDSFDLESIKADEFVFSLEEIAKNPAQASPTQFPILTTPLSSKVVTITNGQFKYKKLNPETVTDRINLDDMHFSEISLRASDLKWDQTIQAKIDDIHFREESGAAIEKLKTNLFISNSNLKLDNLEIETNASKIIGALSSNYSNFDELISNFSEAKTTIDLQESKLTVTDIGTFYDIYNTPTVNLKVANTITYQGSIVLDDKGIDINARNIKIDNNLSADGDIRINTRPNNTSYTVQINSINTTQTYLERLLPEFKLPTEIKNLGRVSGKILASGDQNKINIAQLNLKSSKGTHIIGSGSVDNLNSLDNLQMDLAFEKLHIHVDSLIHKGGSIPEQIFSLGEIDYVGTYKGNLTDINIDGYLQSEIGNADLDLASKFNSEYTNASYSGNFALDSFNLEALLQDTTFGIVTASGSINGSGLSINDLDANVDIQSERFDYQGKTYRDVSVNGKYADSAFDGKIESNDEDLNLSFEGAVNLDGENTVINFNSDLKKLNLIEYGIGDSLLWVSGILSGNLKGDNVDNAIGVAEITNFKLGNQHGVYQSNQPITIVSSKKTGDIKEYKINSEFLDGSIQGNIKLTEVIEVLEAYIRDYIPIESGFEEVAFEELNSFGDQNFIVDIKSKNINPLLDVLTDSKVRIQNGKIGGYFSNFDAEADLKGSADSIYYNGYEIESANFFFDGREDFINGNLIINNVSNSSGTLIQEAIITSTFNDNIADIQVELYDVNDEETLYLGGDISRTTEYVLNFHDSMRIDQEIWEFSEFNEVAYGDDGLYLQDVKITKGKQAITIYTDENDNGQAIETLFDNFELSELTSIIRRENEYFKGEINGAVLINNVWGKPFITTELELDKITISDNPVGKITVVSEQDTETNSVKTEFQLQGSENDASLNLIYSISNSAINGDLQINALNANVIDPFLINITEGSEGILSGNIKIAGTPTKPSLDGKVTIKGLETTPTFTNSRYRLDDFLVNINNQKIDFGSITIYDAQNNEANLSGHILHDHLSDLYLDYKVTSEKINFLNTTSSENPLFYGNVNVNANVSIKGTINDIQIDGVATAIDNSTLTFSPFSVEQIDYDTKFIIYADPRKISLDSLNKKQQQQNANSFPFDVDIKLNVAEDSKFEMIMDPITGDKISGKGIANLNLLLKKSGEIELFGTYTVTSGEYLFSYGIVNKTYDIQPGGTVIFNGDPLDGVLDVTAIYKTKTAVYDLLYLEVGDDFSDAERAEAKRKRDINVVVKLSKSILSPEITMDITAPNEDYGSSGIVTEALEKKLGELRSNPDDLNIQVFGLMILDNFVVSTSANTNLTRAGTNLAISSISGLITSQLNSLTDGLIKGVEFNFDVNSYSSDLISSGEVGIVTEFGVGVSKKLFNDRLTITAGTNIDLENSANKAFLSNIAGDFVLEYKLTEDGAYRVKLFSKSNFNRVLENNSNKNGGSIFVRKEFGEIKKEKEN